MRTISAVPRALQRLMTEQANAIGSREPAKDADLDFGGLAVWVSCSDAICAGFEVEQANATGSSEPARASSPWVRLWAWYPVRRFQNALPECRVARRVSFRGEAWSATGPRTMPSAAGQSSFQGRPFLAIGSEGLTAIGPKEAPNAVAWRRVMAVWHRRRVIGAIGGHRADLLTFRDLVEHLRQHPRRFARTGGTCRLDVTIAAGRKRHSADV